MKRKPKKPTKGRKPRAPRWKPRPVPVTNRVSDVSVTVTPTDIDGTIDLWLSTSTWAFGMGIELTHSSALALAAELVKAVEYTARDVVRVNYGDEPRYRWQMRKGKRALDYWKGDE